MGIERLIQEVRHCALAAGVLVALIAPGPLDAETTGTITGTVTSTVANTKPLRVTIDQNVCGEELPDETIVTDRLGGLANAVVSIAGVKARSTASARGIVNENCRFAPRVQVVQPNGTITTSSADPILHTTNAQTDKGRTIFNVAVPMPSVKITKPVGGAGLLRLTCNTHPWMRGWVWVTDDITAVTGSDGKFTLNEVPAGTYDLRVWHEKLSGGAQRVVVVAGQTANLSFQLK